jgi:hypothetical protein
MEYTIKQITKYQIWQGDTLMAECDSQKEAEMEKEAFEEADAKYG